WPRRSLVLRPGLACEKVTIKIKIKSREEPGLRRLLRRGPRSGKRRPVLLWGGGSGFSVASAALFVGPPRCWGWRLDSPPFRRPKESHRPGGVKSGPSRSRWQAPVFAARLDPARPARFASIAETTGSPNSQESVQKHQGCGARWAGPTAVGRDAGRSTR